jgi:sugar lactone lactonase YvrE
MKTIFRSVLPAAALLLLLCVGSAAAQENLYVAAQMGPTGPITRYGLPDGGNAPQIFATVSAENALPRGLAFDQNGYLYVAYHGGVTNSDSTQLILKFDASGNSTVFANANSGLADPYGLAFGANGDLFVSGRFNGIIQKITPDGSVSFFANAGAQPGPLTFHNGNLYCVNAGGAVMRYDALGNSTQTAQLMNIGLPGGVVFDTYGNLFVSSQLGVEELTAGGTERTVADFISEFPLPGTRGLAIDSQNTLYVSDYTKNTILKLALDGTTSTFATQMSPLFMAVQVPEPTTAALLMLVSSALLLRRRRN